MSEPEWKAMSDADFDGGLIARPILAVVRDPAGKYGLPFVARWLSSHSCWVNPSETTFRAVYPDLWCEIPPINPRS
jgi:hypothetical protein